MRIAVFGATGRTGQALVAEALRSGWEVSALVRPASTAEADPRVALVRGGFDDTAALAQALGGADLACLVFGPRPPYTEVFCADATARILGAMQTGGPARLLCQTGAMIGELPGNVSPGMRFMAGLFRRQQPAVAADRARQEALVQKSGLDWTLAKPPRLRTGPPRGRYRAGPSLRVSLFSSIEREDLARFLVEEARAPRFSRQAVYVAG